MRVERVVLLPLAVLVASCADPASDSRSVAPASSSTALREARGEDARNLGTGGFAKTLCSMLFISEHPDDFAEAHAMRVATHLMKLPAADASELTYEVDRSERLVRVSLGDAITRVAKRYGDQGCVLHPDDHDGIHFVPVPVETTLPDRDRTAWPMGDVLPDDSLPPEVDEAKLEAAIALAFQPPSPVSALVVLYRGRLVGERYAEGITKDTLLENWSMGKSLTATLAARVMHRDGDLALDDPAPVPAWRVPGDPRGAITMAHLFRMSSGLQFSLFEVLELGADGRYHLTGNYPDHYYVYSGAIDVFRYVTSRPLQYEPGTVGRYRNTDPLTLGFIVKQRVEARGEEYLTFPQRELFDAIGIRELVLETDPYGGFVSSGFELGRARDWARLGQLYLQDGVWNDERLLPEGFVDFVRTPAPAWENEENEKSVPRYGGMWWLNTTGEWSAPEDAYYAAGAGGQNTIVIPSREIVVVRLTDYEVSGSPSIGETRFDTALAAILTAIGERS